MSTTTATRLLGRLVEARERRQAAAAEHERAQCDYEQALIAYALAQATDGQGQDRALTVKEVEERLRWSPATVRRVIASGELASIKMGGSRRVRESDLGAFLERK